MNKVFIGLIIGVAVLGLIAAGVLAASWFWTGQAVPRVGSNFFGMPMMSALRLPGFMANWFNGPDSPATGCGQPSGADSFFGGGAGDRGPPPDDAGNASPFINPGNPDQSGPRLTIEEVQAKLEAYLADDAN